MKNRPPILITGSHRSGTTWVGKMLNLARGTLMVDEPFHINEGYETRHYALNGLARYWFTYARELPQKPTRKAYEKVLQKKTGKVFRRRDPKRYLPFLRTGRLIIKDPIAALSADWLYNNFDLKVMVLVRHPGAFVASLKRLNWTFPFSHFLEPQQLLEEQ